MTRLLGVLAIAAPVAVALLILTNPGLTSSWVDGGDRAEAAAATAVLMGIALTATLSWLIVRIRFGRLVRAAERIAGGDYTITVPSDGGGLEARLAAAINGISTALADTYDRATVDRLTGVVNRQALLAALFAEVERASRYERPLCVAFVDIDHFKAVNDTYGHASGDVVLRGVAQTIAENLRASDLIGRYGGEEFMLILTETNVEDGAALSEKLRKLVERCRFSVDGNPELSVTISIGIVGGAGQQLRMETLVRDADAAMYSAKSLGRNQTYIFEEPDEDARVPRAPISDIGRARAMEIGRRARDAATDTLTAFIAPLPHYRGQPSALIAGIVVDMARQLQLPEAEVDRIKVAALLHDVGKVAVPDEILDKPAPLTSAEWRTVVQHPRIGQVILEYAAALKEAVPIILHHHERYGGHGYPYGLRANEIPLGARIVAIADAYDAMIHDRPYKQAMSHDSAILELKEHAGTQFDPELVTLFCDLYANNAPLPDKTVLAMTDPPISQPRRERRTSFDAASTATLASDAEGLVDLGPTGTVGPTAKGRRSAGPGTPPDHRGIATG
ncbi:MAG TPA: diguanylate cyclase [Candidatus Limnocylindrales bacterium]|nr:diguanylate cyclase [Candidatus Limnocylindrales bacterium]